MFASGKNSGEVAADSVHMANPGNTQITTQAIIEMAHKLSLKVISEGVRP